MIRPFTPQIPLSPPVSSVLCVLKPTRVHPRWETRIAGSPIGTFDIKRLGGVRKALLWKSHRQHYRANPRSAAYMLTLAHDFLRRHTPQAQADLLIEPSLDAAIPAGLRGEFRRVLIGTADLTALPPDLLGGRRGYDLLILLYPDATGLGWERTEHLLARLGVPRALVINGRRRVFIWDEAAFRVLRQRRRVDTWFLVEMVTVPVLVVGAALLALYDALKLRLCQRGEV